MNFIMRLIKNRETLRYLGSAVFATITDFGLFSAFQIVLPKQSSFVLAYAFSVTARFMLDRYWTFKERSSGKPEQQFVNYWVISLSAMGFGSIFFAWFSHLQFTPIWAKVLSVPPTTIIAYLGFKLWVFRHSKSPAPQERTYAHLNPRSSGTIRRKQ
jgi:putative flippase GtrA